jgi:tRNA pseudouridine13 synthase
MDVGCCKLESYGMELAYLNKTNGIAGIIKASCDDFIVEEITTDGTVLEIDKKLEVYDNTGKFVHFVLQKKNWTTAGAIKELAKRLRISQKRLSFAGTKDKTAVSTQLASVFGIEREQLLATRVKDIKINGAWKCQHKVQLGSLSGNRFTIKVKSATASKPQKTVKQIFNELDGKFPNYFGQQRFGSSRENTAKIGLLLLKSRFEEAAMEFLTGIEGEQNEQACLARRALAGSNDFSIAVREFPKHLKLERTMIDYLSKNPNNFVGAFRRLPRQIMLLFIHAVQSFIFNETLSERVSMASFAAEDGEYFCDENELGFPDISKHSTSKKGWLVMKLLGYESKPNEREALMLERMDITVDDFRMRSIPEISSKGTFRTALAPLKDFSFCNKENIFRFSLPSGSYATMVLREFIDTKT